jgi:hypothetical protein
VDVVNIFQMTRSTHYPLENAGFSQLKKGLPCYASAEKCVYLVVPGRVFESIKWQPIVAKQAPTAADASSSSSAATARESPPYSNSGADTMDADADEGRGVGMGFIGEHGAEPGEDMEVGAEVVENDHAAVSGIRQFKLLIRIDASTLNPAALCVNESASSSFTV